MTDDGNKIAVALVRFAVANNAGCVARKLMEEGYGRSDFIEYGELKSALYEVYLLDTYLFIQILRKCELHTKIKNWTTDDNYINQLSNAVQNHTGKKIDKSNWWNETLNYLEKQLN